MDVARNCLFSREALYRWVDAAPTTRRHSPVIWVTRWSGKRSLRVSSVVNGQPSHQFANSSIVGLYRPSATAHCDSSTGRPPSPVRCRFSHHFIIHPPCLSEFQSCNRRLNLWNCWTFHPFLQLVFNLNELNWCDEGNAVDSMADIIIIMITHSTSFWQVEYSCNRDYELRSGRQLRLCQEDGTWSGSSPVCQRNQFHLLNQFDHLSIIIRVLITQLFGAVIECGEPDLPVGGYITGFDFTIHSVITYHCEPGHLLSGQRTRNCTGDQTWTGVAPSCTCKPQWNWIILF